MDLVSFEDALITKLLAEIASKAKVRSFPEDFDNYVSQLKHSGGAILVVYQGGLYSPPEGNDTGVLTQDSIHNWQFTVLQQNLRKEKNHHGVYDVLEDIRTILSGFTPAGFDDSSYLFMVEKGFLEKRSGFYIYQITMAHTLEESQA